MVFRSIPEPSPGGPAQRGIEVQFDESVILSRVLIGGPQNRAELARGASFSRSKAAALAAQLLNKGILIETDRSGGDRGRGKSLTVNQDLGYLLGIDIGSTSIDIALADFSCRLIDHRQMETNVNDGPARVLGQAATLLKDILGNLKIKRTEILGIGVGVPGPVSYPSGEVIGGQFTPGWEGYKIQEFLSEDFPASVIRAENDANLMALGSYHKGLAQRSKHFIFVKVGTGIGAGVYCDGKLYRGATSCAGHIGHTCVDFNGPICRCGNQGCLEALAGGAAIGAAAEKAAANGLSILLEQFKQKNQGRLSAVQVGEAAAMGDQAAQGIVVRSATLIGSVLAGVVNFYNPELIVLGGGVSKLGDLFLAEIRREVLKRAYSYTTMGLAIAFSPIRDTAGVIGAVHFIRDWTFLVEGKPLALISDLM